MLLITKPKIPHHINLAPSHLLRRRHFRFSIGKMMFALIDTICAMSSMNRMCVVGSRCSIILLEFIQIASCSVIFHELHLDSIQKWSKTFSHHITAQLHDANRDILNSPFVPSVAQRYSAKMFQRQH